MSGLVHESDPGASSRTSGAPSRRGSTRIPIHSDGAIRFVAAADIDWIDAAGDSVRLYADKSAHVVRKSMGQMLAMLDPSQFLRIHRSTIVNIERVLELQPYFHGEYVVVMRDGTKLKLSRKYRDELSRLLGLRSE